MHQNQLTINFLSSRLTVEVDVCGDDSAEWLNCIPPGGMAQEVLLIPVSSRESGVVCGGEAQNYEYA